MSSSGCKLIWKILINNILLILTKGWQFFFLANDFPSVVTSLFYNVKITEYGTTHAKIMIVKNWPIKAGFPWETACRESSDGLQSCQVLTCFDWYYYGNHESFQVMSWKHCSLQTQAFQVLETRAGNLSVFAGHVIEYHCLGAITLNIALDFINSPCWCWSRALQGCYRIYPHPSSNWKTEKLTSVTQWEPPCFTPTKHF